MIVVLRVYCIERLCPKGQMYQGSIEEGEEDEVVTEAVTGVVIVEEEEDTVPTGVPVAGTFNVIVHNMYTVSLDAHSGRGRGY
jgi:hypothetical protein